MYFNQTNLIVLIVALVSLGSGHTSVSCPHPIQLYRHNTLLPKNGYPNKVSSSNAEIDGTFSSMSALSTCLPKLKSKPLVGPEPIDEHDLVANSIQQLHNQQNHILLGCLFHMPPLSLQSEYDTGTSEPIQYDTDSAISNVIVYGICSLLPPYVLMLRQTTRHKDSGERPLWPYPSGAGIANPHDPILRTGVSMLN